MEIHRIDFMHIPIDIFTDGACSHNPGPGAWGFFIPLCPPSGEPFHQEGFVTETTNNRMELLAVIKALEWFQEHQHSAAAHLRIFSDSTYVVHGITTWIHGWVKNNWRTSQKKPVENKDLWERLLEVSEKYSQLSFHWIRGHNGHPENEAVDSFVQECIQKNKKNRL